MNCGKAVGDASEASEARRERLAAAVPSELMEKARAARQTTGDDYDFIPLPGGNYGIVIADVADKGMGAALVMTSSRTLLRAYAAEHPEAPEQVLLKANQRITQETHGSLFVTLFYGVLNPADGSLYYCNSRHNPPYLWLPGRTAQSLTRTGVPLGVFSNAAWETRRVTLEPGGVLVLYTDGVTEAAGPDEQLFGESRLIEAVQRAAPSSTSAQELQDKILAQIDDFRSGVNLSDDLTLVLLVRR
jgi:serine phosphatase RsbU (regulator of sigma subunit)